MALQNPRDEAMAQFHSPDDIPHFLGLLSNDTPPSNSSSDDPSSAISYITYVDDSLAFLYALLALTALVQLIRIQVRLPQVHWTTQKVFHVLNFLTATCRAIVFACRSEVEDVIKESRPFLYTVLLDAPGLLFFSTYTLLILFWAEIYYQATVSSTLTAGRGTRDAEQPSGGGAHTGGAHTVGGGGPPPHQGDPPQKRVFLMTNLLAYAAFIALSASTPRDAAQQAVIVQVFFAGLAMVTTYLFLLYGARLFMLLRRFPLDSRGRRSKLQEIGMITSIACTCFSVRSFLLVESVLHGDESRYGLDVMGHPVINGAYYLGCEIVPMALVMYILRKLPPKMRQSSRGGTSQERTEPTPGGRRHPSLQEDPGVMSAGAYQTTDAVDAAMDLEEPLLEEDDTTSP